MNILSLYTYELRYKRDHGLVALYAMYAFEYKHAYRQAYNEAVNDYPKFMNNDLCYLSLIKVENDAIYDDSKPGRNGHSCPDVTGSIQ